MTVQELIDELTDKLESGEVAEDTEVRLAHQPRWAFEYAIQGIALRSESASDEDDDASDAPEDNVVYICEGTQLGYLDCNPWSAC